ncbi:MAG: hypothetical protein H7Y28_15195 [Rhodoferax sp.]|nr:hypothetical protein [Rhodoferax sp.]
MTNPEDSQLLATGPFSGPAAFTGLVRAAIACAAREGWKQMTWCDANFEDWPLREKAVVEDLHAWAGSGRKLVLLAQNFDAMERYHARFVEWRIRWDHIVECRTCRPRAGTEFPSVLWGPHWFMHRLDMVRCRGVSSYEAQTRVGLQEELEEFRKQSTPGFPATRLGL